MAYETATKMSPRFQTLQFLGFRGSSSMKSTSKHGSLDMEATDVAMEVCVCVLYGRAASSAGVSKDVRASACSYGERGSDPDEEEVDGRDGRRLGSISNAVNVLSELCDGSALDVFGMAACFSSPGAIVTDVEGEDGSRGRLRSSHAR